MPYANRAVVLSQLFLDLFPNVWHETNMPSRRSTQTRMDLYTMIKARQKQLELDKVAIKRCGERAQEYRRTHNATHDAKVPTEWMTDRVASHPALLTDAPKEIADRLAAARNIFGDIVGDLNDIKYNQTNKKKNFQLYLGEQANKTANSTNLSPACLVYEIHTPEERTFTDPTLPYRSLPYRT